MKPEPNGFAGAAISLVAIFVPGILALIAALPFWESLSETHVGASRHARHQCSRCRPAWRGPLQSGLDDLRWWSADFGLALVGFALLTVWQAPPLIVVAVTALGGVVLAL